MKTKIIMYIFIIMNANYWVRAILIIAVFVILSGFVLSTTGSQNIKDNWPLYQCNPAVIPFSAQLQPDNLTTTTEENFTYCVQNTMGSFSSVLTAPLDFITNSIGDVLGGITTGMGGLQDALAALGLNSGDTGSSLFSSITNVVIYTNVLITKMSDMQGKMSAITTVLLNCFTTLYYSMMSMFNGSVGALFKWADGGG